MVTISAKFKVLHADIVKRTQHPFFEGILETNFIGDLVVKELKDVEVVIPFRRGRHPQEKGRLEVVQQGLISRSPRMVHFINQNVIKSIRGKLGITLFLGQGLDGRKEVLGLPIVLAPG